MTAQGTRSGPVVTPASGAPASSPSQVQLDVLRRYMQERGGIIGEAALKQLLVYERTLRAICGYTADKADQFRAIPFLGDVSLGLVSYLTPDRFPRAQNLIRYPATVRLAYSACSFFSKKIVGSYTTAMTAAALLAWRLPNNPVVKKATELLKQHPQAKGLLMTWYTATCATLLYKAHQSFMGVMNTQQRRRALKTKDTGGAAGAGAGGDGSAVGERYNNDKLKEAVNRLKNTSGVSYDEFLKLANLAVERGQNNRATEDALWAKLEKRSNEFEGKEATNIQQATDAHATAAAAVAAAGGVIVAGLPLLKAEQLADIRLKKLQLEVIRREMHNLPMEHQVTTKAERAEIECKAMRVAIYLDILPLLERGPDIFMDGLAALSTKYGKEAFATVLQDIMNVFTLGPVGANPAWTAARVADFIEAVDRAERRIANPFQKFLAGGVFNQAMLDRLPDWTCRLAVNAHTEAINAKRDVVNALPNGVTLNKAPALKAVEKRNAVQQSELDKDRQLAKDAATDIKTVDSIATLANNMLVNDSRLFPDVSIMFNPDKPGKIWLSQVRPRQVPKEFGEWNVTPEQFKAKLAGASSASGRDQYRNPAVYFEFDPDEVLKLVLDHDIKNMDFQECLVAKEVRPGVWGLRYEKPTAQNQVLDHRLTAALFQFLGVHYQGSLVKTLLAGNLHDKEPAEITKIQKQIQFLDKINANHFVTKPRNGPSFVTQDDNYVKHATAYGIIRQELVTQLAHREATIAATKAVKARKRIEPQPEAAWGTKSALQDTLNTFWRRRSDVNYVGNNLRCRAFNNAYDGLFDSIKAMADGLGKQTNTHEALRLAVVSSQPDNPEHRPLLESFYRHAYMLKHMLDNNHVIATLAAEGMGSAVAATKLRQNIDALMTQVDTIYGNHLSRVENGAQAVHAAKTHQLKVQAQELGKIYAHTDFALNGFEPKAPTVGQKVIMAGVGLTSLFA